MLKILLISLVAPACNFLVNLVFKQEHKWYAYLISYTLLVLLNLLFIGKAHASIISHQQIIPIDYEKYFDDYEYSLKRELKNMSLSYNQRQTYVRLINEHEKFAKSNLEEAKQKCAWLPSMDDRSKAQHCFTTIMATITNTTPMSKIIGALASMLTIYGINVLYEWNEIQTLLGYSQYHYEMKEFYEQVLIKY